jgi:hypothetical protein
MSELATMDAEDAREYSESLAQIGEGWWRLNAWAFRQGIPESLGMPRRVWAEKYHGYLKLPAPERQKAVAELAAGGMNNSQIADSLGVTEGTVRNDLKGDSQNYESAPESDSGPQVESSVSDVHSQNYESEQIPAETVTQHSDDEAELDVDEPEGEAPDAEPLPLQPAEPGWHKLGDHLLYCGDSTDQEFIDACQGALAFADPPYNAGKADWDKGFEWRHDYLADAADIVAVTPGIAALAGFLATTTMPYQWSVSAEITNGMTRGALGFGNWICVTLFSHGSIYRKAKDHMRIPAATGDDQGGGHASRKPIRLMTHLIALFTSKGDTVIDPFLGSGTTLIAAERTGRRCVGAELDPMHCAEIIARYKAGGASA